MSGIVWTRSLIRATRYRPERTSLPYFDDLQIRLCDIDGETLQTYINVKAKFGALTATAAYPRLAYVSIRMCSIRRSNWRRGTV